MCLGYDYDLNWGRVKVQYLDMSGIRVSGIQIVTVRVGVSNLFNLKMI